jgi:hypothetical protein
MAGAQLRRRLQPGLIMLARDGDSGHQKWPVGTRPPAISGAAVCRALRRCYELIIGGLPASVASGGGTSQP